MKWYNHKKSDNNTSHVYIKTTQATKKFHEFNSVDRDIKLYIPKQRVNLMNERKFKGIWWF
jgi:hypothetical protein